MTRVALCAVGLLSTCVLIGYALGAGGVALFGPWSAVVSIPAAGVLGWHAGGWWGKRAFA